MEMRFNFLNLTNMIFTEVIELLPTARLEKRTTAASCYQLPNQSFVALVSGPPEDDERVFALYESLDQRQNLRTAEATGVIGHWSSTRNEIHKKCFLYI